MSEILLCTYVVSAAYFQYWHTIIVHRDRTCLIWLGAQAEISCLNLFGNSSNLSQRKAIYVI